MVISWPFSRTRKIKCPDGTIRIVYKHVDDAFPLYIPGWEGKADGSFSQQDTQAAIKAEYRSMVNGLLYRFDELNQNLMMSFRGAYLVYMSDPCGQSKYLEQRVTSLGHEQHRLRMLREQITGLLEMARINANNNDQIIALFQEIVNQIGGSVIPLAAKFAIEDSRKDAKKWLGGGSDS